MSFAGSLSWQPAHGLCLAAALLIIPANFVGIYGVVMARKRFEVKYPALYADKSHKYAHDFNCVQRGHQNFLENVPIHFMVLGIASIYRPKVAALAALVRTAGFIAYMRGYATGKVENRNRGAFGYLGFFTMFFLACEVAGRLIADGLL